MSYSLYDSQLHTEADAVQNSPTVFVVDDELAVRRSIESLLSNAGYRSMTFSSAELFLENYDSQQAGCVIADLKMGGMSGLELQENLATSGSQTPVIIMSGYANVPAVVRAMRTGAVDFIEKPFTEERLLDRVEEAITLDQELRAAQEHQQIIEQRIDRLSAREAEIMQLLTAGKTTKQISASLSISPKTVDVHRARVLEKMQVDSVVELVLLVSTK